MAILICVFEHQYRQAYPKTVNIVSIDKQFTNYLSQQLYRRVCSKISCLINFVSVGYLLHQQEVIGREGIH